MKPLLLATLALVALHIARAGELLLDWKDAKRNREVPVKIYLPESTGEGTPKFPVIIFSHGLGGSRDGYEYLGKYWAQHGYAAVHLQHLGSDSAILKDIPPADIPRALRRATMRPENIFNRPLDVRFAIDQLTALNSDTNSPLHDKLDLDHIGIAGHSFGAFTTMAIAGQSFQGGGNVAPFRDPRVKAGLALSTPVAGMNKNRDEIYAAIKIPIFHMTGTKDDSPVGDTSAPERRIPFDHTRRAQTYLLTFNDGDHMLFAGRRLTGEDLPGDAKAHELIQKASTAFWDATLKNDPKALEYLETGPLAADLGPLGTFEQRKPDVRLGDLLQEPPSK